MNDEQLYAMRHSLAHITAQAVQHLWPEARFGVGPVVENGFYYDIDLGETKISEDDFPKIEAEMRKIVEANYPFEQSDRNIDDAIEWATTANQPYKVELLNDLKRAGTTVAKDLDSAELGLKAEGEGVVEKVSFYADGDFTDLCRGPHATTTGSVGIFKLMRVAGAYWRGKSDNAQMQRLYGVAFQDQKDLDNYLAQLEEAKKRDHRVLGEKLQLFFFSDSVGAGLPLLMPRGEMIKKTLMDYMREKEENRGYQFVSTPVLTQRKLYERSGHADYYLENMYATKEDEEGNMFFIKPMNCPHHHMIFEKLVTSYRDLPLRLSEHAGLYRYELSGTLTGLIRMRGPITQNDSHTYLMPEQLESEFTDLIRLFDEVYLETGVSDYWFRLSLPDFSKGKYAGDQERWEWAAEQIRKSLDTVGAKYVEELDEAAFYGPKLDVQIKNVLGKEDSIATVQIDILVPERMGIVYVDSNGDKQYPIVIHKSIMGAFERFMGYLLEQTGGNLPLWLSPEQLRIIQVKDSAEVVNFVQQLVAAAREKGLRVKVDDDNQSVGKKIRDAEVWKVPYTLVVGEKEVQQERLKPRVRSDLAVLGDVEREYEVDQFLSSLANEVKARASKSSL